MKGKVIPMKNNAINAALAAADKPAAIQFNAVYAAPAAFRHQERFWTEVKRRIIARRPDAARRRDRLY